MFCQWIGKQYKPTLLPPLTPKMYTFYGYYLFSVAKSDRLLCTRFLRQWTSTNHEHGLRTLLNPYLVLEWFRCWSQTFQQEKSNVVEQRMLALISPFPTTLPRRRTYKFYHNWKDERFVLPTSFLFCLQIFSRLPVDLRVWFAQDLEGQPTTCFLELFFTRGYIHEFLGESLCKCVTPA